MKRSINTFSLLLVLFLSVNLNAKDLLKSAYYDLSIYNYFGAKEKFEKAVKKHPVAASFGLSEIYKNDRNPFFNLDSARVFALRSQDSWPISKEKERLKIADYGVDSLSINEQLDEIAILALDFSITLNTVEGFNSFIDNYGYSSLKTEAIKSRNELVYAGVKTDNTAVAYREFMNFYPNAIQFDDAKEQYDLRVFEESNSFKNIQDIEDFIDEYPNSPYLSQAQDNLYMLFTNSGKLSVYREFIKKYPRNPNVDASWENIYKIETEHVSPEVLADFLLEYPKYPMREKVKEELANLLLFLVPARMNNKWGFVDMEGNWIIRPIYESCEPFSEGMSLISKEDKFGFINTRGDEVVLTEYEDAESYENGLAIVYNGENYGAVNRFGDITLEVEYDDIGEFVDGVAYASKNGKYGYIDEKGYVLIPFVYDQAFSFNKKKALAKQNGKYGIVDEKNKWLIPFEYDWIGAHFNDSLIKVKIGPHYGLINFNLDTILPIDNKHIGNISQKMILVVKDSKVGYINAKGEWLIPLIYESDPFVLDWGEFDRDLARIRIKGKMGIIDSSGARIVPAIFEEIGEYDGKLYPVKKYGKWGYADDKIKLVVGYKYQALYPYEGDFARAKRKGKWGIIDRSGKAIIPFEGKKITPVEGVYIFENDSAFGMIDYEMNVILDPIFDDIKYNKLGYFELLVNGKIAYLDINRRKVFWKELGFLMPN